MASKILILLIGIGFSSLSFAQSSANIRDELKSLNQTLHSVSDLTTASKSTKSNILNQLIKIRSEISDMDLSKVPSGVQQDLQKRMSTAVDSATHIDRYSAILIDEALTGLDTDLLGVQLQQKPSQEAVQAKAGNSHAKVECTPAPPSAVICNGEYFKKDNTVLTDSTLKAISEKALSQSSLSGEDEASGETKASEAF